MIADSREAVFPGLTATAHTAHPAHPAHFPIQSYYARAHCPLLDKCAVGAPW